jgi:hypothetical protein
MTKRTIPQMHEVVPPLQESHARRDSVNAHGSLIVDAQFN